MRRVLITFLSCSCLCWCFAAPVAAQLCPAGATGDCFVANGTPGCVDAECCEAVCLADDFCCSTEWDQLCADAASAICAGAPLEACCFTDGSCLDLTTADCGSMGGSSQGPGSDCLNTVCAVVCPGDGDCFDPLGNGSPGCSDAECCSIVCALDPFCCETEWDDLCASAALELCAGAPMEACCFFDASCLDLTTAECDTLGGTPQGPGSDCLNTVCLPACPGAGDCFAPDGNGSPGCADEDCCNAVCAVDTFCCETEWDGLCAAQAMELCAGAPCVRCPGDVNFDDNRNGLDVQAMSDCLLNPLNGPGQPKAAGCGCADTDGDNDVDLDDIASFVAILLDMSGACPVCGPGNGACFDLAGNGSGGCEDAECCASVCAADAFCCETEWDGVCAAQANAICNGIPTEACCFAADTCFDIGGADCVTLGGTPQGFGSTCATVTCTPTACGPGAGNCFTDTNSPGCDDPVCCSAVCAVDAFCCDTEWDGLCAAEAQGICNGAVTEACCIFGDCFDTPPADCSALGGTPAGAGTSCAVNPCP